MLKANVHASKRASGNEPALGKRKKHRIEAGKREKVERRSPKRDMARVPNAAIYRLSRGIAEDEQVSEVAGMNCQLTQNEDTEKKEIDLWEYRHGELPHDEQYRWNEPQNQKEPGAYLSERVDVTLEKWSEFVAAFEDNLLIYAGMVEPGTGERQGEIGHEQNNPDAHTRPEMLRNEIGQFNLSSSLMRDGAQNRSFSYGHYGRVRKIGRPSL